MPLYQLAARAHELAASRWAARERGTLAPEGRRIHALRTAARRGAA